MGPPVGKEGVSTENSRPGEPEAPQTRRGYPQPRQLVNFQRKVNPRLRKERLSIACSAQDTTFGVPRPCAVTAAGMTPARLERRQTRSEAHKEQDHQHRADSCAASTNHRVLPDGMPSEVA